MMCVCVLSWLELHDSVSVISKMHTYFATDAQMIRSSQECSLWERVPKSDPTCYTLCFVKYGTVTVEETGVRVRTRTNIIESVCNEFAIALLLIWLLQRCGNMCCLQSNLVFQGVIKQQ